MKKRSAWMVFVLLALLAVASLAVDGQAAGLRRPGNPLLEPLANAQDVSRHTHVGIDYDENIDPVSISPQTFAVYGAQTGLVQQVLSEEDGNIDLAPARAFHMGELVFATATTQTLSLVDGLGPLQPTVWMFRVGVEGGTGYFGSTGQPLGDYSGQDVELGDLDGDGDLDAFVANCGASYAWRNDGNARFVSNGQALALSPSDCSVNVSLGDLDGDGDLDAVNVLVDGIQVWLNTGAGYFFYNGQDLGGTGGTSAELGDLDGDGDLDIFYTIRNAPNWVYLNNGNGQFSQHSYTPDTDASTGAALGDLDEDGDLDAWVTVSNGSSTEHRVYMNNGNATFTVGQTIPAYPANSVSLGDLDGDGDLDAFLAVVKLGATGPNQVWFNNGAGTFTDSGQRMGENSTNQIILGDLNGDGDLDAVAVNMNMPNEVWHNTGNGNYIRGSQIFVYVNTPHTALGDLNGDGSLDLFMVRFDEPDQVMLNQGEQHLLYLPWLCKR